MGHYQLTWEHGMRVLYEHTDTFGGEPNYCWVDRGEIILEDNASDAQIVREVKKRIGMSGVKCDRLWSYDGITLKPRRVCQIIFINFGE
jgi:hypothetical protein